MIGEQDDEEGVNAMEELEGLRGFFFAIQAALRVLRMKSQKGEVKKSKEDAL